MKTGYEKVVEHMGNNWLDTKGKQAKFFHSLWRKYHIPESIDVHMTNNLIENFHKNIIKKLASSSKPCIKRCMGLLQEIEDDNFSKETEM